MLQISFCMLFIVDGGQTAVVQAGRTKLTHRRQMLNTKLILFAINDLKNKGHRVEFITDTGRSPRNKHEDMNRVTS